MMDMTEQELAAWNGLIEGDPEPLADLLESEPDRLHPILGRWLLKLLRGSKEETDYRLAITKHPDLKRPSDGLQWKRAVSGRELSIALRMARNGALESGNYEAAMAATMEQTGLSRSTIAAHWSGHKDFLRMCRARGILD